MAQHVHIADALSGRRLDVLEQCVPITVTADARLEEVVATGCSCFPRSSTRAEGVGVRAQDVAARVKQMTTSIKDASGLSAMLEAWHAEWCTGDVAVGAVAAALLTAPPAAGKTSLMSQVH